MTQQYNELEEMRQQLSILKGKLDDQEIVNEQMIRESMGNKMAYVWRVRLVSVATILILLKICRTLWLETPLSHAFVIYMFTVTALAIIANVLLYRVSRKDLLSGNLLDVAKQLQQQIKLRKKKRMIALPFLFSIMIWLFIELYVKIGGSSPLTNPAFLVSLLCGLVCFAIGMVLGLRSARRIKHTNQEVIDQINSIKAGEEREE